MKPKCYSVEQTFYRWKKQMWWLGGFHGFGN